MATTDTPATATTKTHGLQDLFRRDPARAQQVLVQFVRAIEDRYPELGSVAQATAGPRLEEGARRVLALEAQVAEREQRVSEREHEVEERERRVGASARRLDERDASVQRAEQYIQDWEAEAQARERRLGESVQSISRALAGVEVWSSQVEHDAGVAEQAASKGKAGIQKVRDAMKNVVDILRGAGAGD